MSQCNGSIAAFQVEISGQELTMAYFDKELAKGESVVQYTT